MPNLAGGGQRAYRTFVHKRAVFRICCPQYGAVVREIVRQRRLLEHYIRRDPTFRRALGPVQPRPEAPEVAQRMAHAAALTRVGPMAAVAGAMAQFAVEAGLRAGAPEAIVDNGGDIYLKAEAPVTIALGTGSTPLADRLAFALQPEDTPIAICSSSATMGHSLSLGACDLAVVVAHDAALADAAATLAGNLVTTIEQIGPALEQVLQIEGIDGLLMVKDEHVGLAGRLPQLVKAAG